jgi:hypothetical protein
VDGREKVENVNIESDEVGSGDGKYGNNDREGD